MASTLERISSALAGLGKRRAPTDVDDDHGLGSPLDETGHATAFKRKKLVFRPWDQADMHRRLETYRPLTWFGKPDVVGPIACASRGWCNESRDQLCCDFCGVRLRFPADVPLEARERAAALFSTQLSERHATTCPWRHTVCDDTVLAFNPATAIHATTATPHRPSSTQASRNANRTDTLSLNDGMQDAYHARLAQLERCEQLPDVYMRAVEQMASQANSPVIAPAAHNASGGAPVGMGAYRPSGWGTDGLRRVLALPPPPVVVPSGGSSDGAAMPPAFDPAVPIVLPRQLSVTQKARLLALLGWEPQEMPPGTTGRPHYLCPYRPTNEPYALAHLVTSGGGHGGGSGGGASSGATRTRWPMDNVVLSCPACKSRVGLWNFVAQGGDNNTNMMCEGAAAGSLLIAAHNAATTTAAAAARQLPSVVIEELPDEASGLGTTAFDQATATRDMEVEAAPSMPRAPSVPLVRTIAGGVFEQTASGNVPSRRTSGSSVGGGGVFGNPLASRGPVYGLNALTALPNAKPTVPDLDAPFEAMLTPSRGVSGAGVATAAAGGGTAAAAAAGHKRAAEQVITGVYAAATPGATEKPAAAVSAACQQQKQSEASKRRRTASSAGVTAMAAVTFDPLSHHRQWCPWVFTGSNTGGTTAAAAAGGSPVPDAAAPGASPSAAGGGCAPKTKCGWMHLLDTLSAPPPPPTTTAGGAAAAGDAHTPSAPAERVDSGGVAAMDLDVADQQREVSLQVPASAPPAVGGEPPARDMTGLRNSILQALRGL